jgi:hypothetical protein
MDAEIEFFHKGFTEENQKVLIDHVRRMSSGEAPLFPKTLSLVYRKLFEKAFARPITSGSGLENSPEIGGPGVAESAATAQASAMVWLKCSECGECARLQFLHYGLRCPQCPRRGATWERPLMQCSSCNLSRETRGDNCAGPACEASFL